MSWRGVKVCREAPTISHLLFADGSLILMQADKKNVDCLTGILNRYCASSGQKKLARQTRAFISQQIQRLKLRQRYAKF